MLEQSLGIYLRSPSVDRTELHLLPVAFNSVVTGEKGLELLVQTVNFAQVLKNLLSENNVFGRGKGLFEDGNETDYSFKTYDYFINH